MSYHQYFTKRNKMKENYNVSGLGPNARYLVSKQGLDKVQDSIRDIYPPKNKTGTFYCVLYPSFSMGIEDVVFETDAFGFALQVKGGLSAQEIYMITPSKAEAYKTGKMFLATVKELELEDET